MSEQSPSMGGVGPERKIFKYEDIPLLYQSLGKACADAGILGEFYGCVDAGYDFGEALKSLRPQLIEKLKLDHTEDVEEYFRKFDLIYGVDDEEFGDDTTIKW